jgi:predicted metal-dependent hydrolase
LFEAITDIGDRHPSSVNHSPLERKISEYNNKTGEEELITLLLNHEVGQRNNSRKRKVHAHIHRAVEQQMRKDWVHTAYTSYKIQD